MKSQGAPGVSVDQAGGARWLEQAATLGEGEPPRPPLCGGSGIDGAQAVAWRLRQSMRCTTSECSRCRSDRALALRASGVCWLDAVGWLACHVSLRAALTGRGRQGADGTGQPDRAAAGRWFEKAAAAGDAKSAFALWSAYQHLPRAPAAWQTAAGRWPPCSALVERLTACPDGLPCRQDTALAARSTGRQLLGAIRPTERGQSRCDAVGRTARPPRPPRPRCACCTTLHLLLHLLLLLLLH